MPPFPVSRAGTELCKRSRHCLTLPVWKELDRRIDEYLESVTLEDVLEKKVKIGEEFDGAGKQ